MNSPANELSPRTLRFEIPEPTILLNRWQRMHHRERTRHAKRMAWVLRAALGCGGRKAFAQCHIEIERHCNPPLPDWDGLYGGLKPLLDCLVVPSQRNPHGLGIIEDDNPSCVLSLVARPMPAPPKEGKTVVTIREAA